MKRAALLLMLAACGGPLPFGRATDETGAGGAAVASGEGGSAGEDGAGGASASASATVGVGGAGGDASSQGGAGGEGGGEPTSECEGAADGSACDEACGCGPCGESLAECAHGLCVAGACVAYREVRCRIAGKLYSGCGGAESPNHILWRDGSCFGYADTPAYCAPGTECGVTVDGADKGEGLCE